MTVGASAAQAAALSQWRLLHILVNNAAVGTIVVTPDIDEDSWHKVYAVNIQAKFLFCRAANPALRVIDGTKAHTGQPNIITRRNLRAAQEL